MKISLLPLPSEIFFLFLHFQLYNLNSLTVHNFPSTHFSSHSLSFNCITYHGQSLKLQGKQAFKLPLQEREKRGGTKGRLILPLLRLLSVIQNAKIILSRPCVFVR